MIRLSSLLLIFLLSLACLIFYHDSGSPSNWIQYSASSSAAIKFMFVNADKITAGDGNNNNEIKKDDQSKPRYRTALVTLANKKEYALGALVLAKSIKATKSLNPDSDLVLIVPLNSLEEEILAWLREYWIIVHPPDAPFIDTKNSKRHDLNVIVPPKLYTWMLTQYDRVVYIDSDSFFRKKVDWFNQDQYWTGDFTGLKMLDVDEDSFIGGLLLLRPSEIHYKALMDLLYTQPTNTYVHADQGLLNIYFQKEWRSKPEKERLPITEEVTAAHCVIAATYTKTFRNFFFKMMMESSVYDFQGLKKPWDDWPNEFLYPECNKVIEFAKTWALIALSLDMKELAKVIDDFYDTLAVPEKTANVIIKKFVTTFKKGKVSKHLGLLIRDSIKSLYKVPIKEGDWGSDKPKVDL